METGEQQAFVGLVEKLNVSHSSSGRITEMEEKIESLDRRITDVSNELGELRDFLRTSVDSLNKNLEDIRRVMKFQSDN